MMLSLYVTLGIFLLLAVRSPSEHRSLVAFTAWSSFAHAAVMTVMAIYVTSAREGLLMVSALLGVIVLPLSCWRRQNDQQSEFQRVRSPIHLVASFNMDSCQGKLLPPRQLS